MLPCRVEIQELWSSPINSLNKSCGDLQNYMLQMSYSFLLRRSAFLGSLSHQLKSISTRGNMKLVFIMPVKLSKVSEIIFSKKKCQVIDDCFNAPFCVTGILKYQVEGKQFCVTATFTYYGISITCFQVVYHLILLQIFLSLMRRLGSC